MKQSFWLFKSEPEVFSIDDLKNSPLQTTCWDGVRNYKARNFIRDEIKKGDGVLFYHSNAEPLAIVGTCIVVKEGYADHTQFDKNNIHYDEKAKKDNPTWFMVDIKLEKIFKNPVTLAAIKMNPKLKDFRLLQKGNRLSVFPVSKDEWNEILKMSNT